MFEKYKLTEIVNKIGGTDRIIDTQSDLSEGEKQIINLCRILVHKNNIIILDEPTASLHNDIKQLTFDIIRKMNEAYQTTFVVITHDKCNNFEFEEINL